MTVWRGLGSLVLLTLVVGGCQRPGPPQPPTGSASPGGWQVRYNAAQALARRGSEKATEPAVVESLVEMLDEEQQLRNFRRKLPDGREVADETAARLTVIGGITAVTELYRKRPGTDVTPFRKPLEKLTQSAAAPVRTEALQAQLTMFKN